MQHNPGRIVVAIIQKRNPTEGRKHRTTGTIAPKLVFIDYCAKGGEVPIGKPPFKGVLGGGNRRRRTSPRRRSHRTRKTSRGSGSGRSYHHSTTQPRKNRGRNNHKHK